MELQFKFRNKAQREFYYATARNQCFSGGFNNGKSWAGCFKAITLLLTFSNYRMIIAREKYTDLKRTTMQTFLKMCPSELIQSHNEQDGLTQFTNGSQVYWMHLDNVDENSLRGIEPNSILVDQAEEIQEKVYDVLDSRVGRWDGAIVSPELIRKYPDWPRDEHTNRYFVPSYHMLLSNPDTQFHFIYRKYHPESEFRNSNYFYAEGEWDASLGSEETYQEALKRDPEWVEKYVKGKWGFGSSSIHYLRPESILEYSEELLTYVLQKGNLFRVLDHGDSAPTCCLWFAAVGGVYICYREYYVPGKVISYHRKSISELSGDEYYSNNWADPQIFKKTAQKQGGFWSVSDEYHDKALDAPALYWQPADNNEFATRNRINELLSVSSRYVHPITKEAGAPGLYFIKASSTYSNGCKETIRQIGAQRKKLLGTIEGKSIYSDERDENITDHAYDCVRYFVAQHGVNPAVAKKKAPRMSFAHFNNLLKQHELFRPASV